MSDFDVNKISAEVFTELTKDFIKSSIEFIPGKLRNNFIRYFDNFGYAVDRYYRTCSTVRTIINKDKPVPIDDIYVKGIFKCGDEKSSDDELCQHVRDGKRIVITGFGGIGKTVFCKHLWMTIFQNPAGKVPIFFELRSLNEITQQNLETYLRASLTHKDKIIPVEIFRGMMLAGRFVFILDGFDEVPEENRLEIQSQILELSHDYPECGFIVSSRFDDRFVSWQNFYLYRAEPFNKSQTREVIRKVEFDEEIKKEFVNSTLDKRYDEYKTFFETPLLSLMMLMTYMQIKYVPESRHIFYRYAFQTLYTLHDASKQGFQRKRFVRMSESEFMNTFSLFSLVTYIEGEHSFTKREILKYFDKVKIRSKANYKSADFLNECLESVNLIYKDGDAYSFTHRSFQEYFSAYATTHYFHGKIADVIEKIPIQPNDSVFSMIYDLSPNQVEEFYIIPYSEKYEEQMHSVINEERDEIVLEIVGSNLLVVRPFRSRNSPSVGFAYRMYSRENLDKFVQSMMAMFKSRVPKETSRALADFKRIDKSINAILKESKLPKYSVDLVDSHLEVDIDFLSKEARCRSIGFESTGKRSAEFEVDLEYSVVIRHLKSFKVLQFEAKSIRSNISFVNNISQKIGRNVGEMKNAGDEVLSL